MSHYTLRDAGEAMMMPTVSGGGEKDKWYQTIRFDITQLPEIGTWAVGNKYYLVVEVKQVEHSIREDSKNEKEQGVFEVRKVAAFSPEVDKYGSEVIKKLKLG